MTKLCGWIALLAGAVGALAKAGRGALATPPLDRTFARWVGDSPPQFVLFSLVRLAALAIGCYLLAAALLSVFALITRWHPIIHVADLLTPRFLRVVISVAVTSAAFPPLVAAAAPAPNSTAAPSAGDPPPTMVLLTPAPTFKPQPMTWVVQRGDNFWTIATRVADSPADVAPYWTRLVARNRALLRFPTDPDLLYAGQKLDLPPQ